MERMRQYMPEGRISMQDENSGGRAVVADAWQYVGDISQRCAGDDAGKVQQTTISKVLALVGDAREQGVVLSDKSAILSNNPMAATNAQKHQEISASNARS